MKKAFRSIASAVMATSMLASVIPAAFADGEDPYNRESLQLKIQEETAKRGITYVIGDKTLGDGTTIQAGTATVALKADTDVKDAESETSEYSDMVLSKTFSKNAAASVTGNFRSYLFLDEVRAAFEAYMASAEAEVKKDSVMSLLLPTIPVTGSFTIETIYDDDMEIANKEEFLKVGNMYGFNDTAKEIFVDTERTDVEDAEHPGYRKFTVKVKVKAPTTKDLQGVEHTGSWANTLVYADLEKSYQTLLADINFTVPAITASKAAMDVTTYYTESINMYGGITIGAALSDINFETIQGNPGKEETVTRAAGENRYNGTEDWQDISATMALAVRSSTGGSSSSTGSKSYSTPTPARPTLAPGATLAPGETPNPDATPNPEATVTPNASAVPGINPNRPLPNMDPNGNFVPSNHTVPSALNGEDHMVYVIGYPEGDVRPLRSITREEIATIFYRLLTDVKRDSIYTKESPFSDVLKSRWSNKAIATMANGKYILGDAGKTTFRPSDAITRAEMAAIVSRFLDTTPEIKDISEDFTDLGGHWAQEAIAQGVAAGWLTGYTDHSFKPDQQITRAEAMTVINRMLVRYVREGGLAEGYVEWPDNPQDAWYYYNVIEATNSHEYNTRTFETTDDYYETWPSIITNWIWGDFKTAYEDPDEIDKQ